MIRIAGMILLILACSFRGSGQGRPQAAPNAVTRLGNIKQVLKNGQWVYPVVTTEEILVNPRINISPDGYNVVSYEITIIPTDLGYPVGPFRVLGGDFTPQVMQALRDNAGKSGKILVDAIKAQDPDSQIKNYNSIELEYRN